jgi:hypothetical protein
MSDYTKNTSSVCQDVIKYGGKKTLHGRPLVVKTETSEKCKAFTKESSLKGKDQYS